MEQVEKLKRLSTPRRVVINKYLKNIGMGRKVNKDSLTRD